MAKTYHYVVRWDPYPAKGFTSLMVYEIVGGELVGVFHSGPFVPPSTVYEFLSERLGPEHNYIPI